MSEKPMRISEAANQCGLSIDTIRYYEKEGLLPEVPRSSDGQRRFTAESVDWLILLGSLRETGMAMTTMSRFAALYRDGDRTIPERRQILRQHSEQLSRRRQEVDRCEELLSYKLKMYDKREAEPRS